MLILLFIVVVFGTMALNLSASQVRTGVKYEENVKALHTAEAGIHHYLWYLNKDGATPISTGTEIKYPNHNPDSAYMLEIVDDSNFKKVIKSTGWQLSDPNNKRVITTTVSKRSFLEYVYFSDNDPDGIWWTSIDRCYGPYHTNSNLSISGNPIFFGIATYASGIKYNPGSNNPQFKKGHSRVTAQPMPASNTELMSHAKNGGYYYEGRTSIRLNSDGTISIWNPKTSTSVVKRNIPLNGVIYVDGTSPAINGNKFDQNAGNVFISGILKGKLTIAASNDIFITDRDPTVNNFNGSGITGGVKYVGTGFNLNTTTGDTTITGTSKTDMLGLVANRNVTVLTYGWFNSANVESARGGKEFIIHGAVCAINGKFGNSRTVYGGGSPTSPGSPSKLLVRGAIIQKERGSVGYTTGSGSSLAVSSGYAKDYAHDPRFSYDGPPHFLEPTDSGWEIQEWKE